MLTERKIKSIAKKIVRNGLDIGEKIGLNFLDDNDYKLSDNDYDRIADTLDDYLAECRKVLTRKK